MDKLIKILEEIRPDVDFETSDDLIDAGFLDSFDIATLVEEISNEYGVEISVDDLIPENFSSAEKIYELIQAYC